MTTIDNVVWSSKQCHALTVGRQVCLKNRLFHFHNSLSDSSACVSPLTSSSAHTFKTRVKCWNLRLALNITSRLITCTGSACGCQQTQFLKLRSWQTSTMDYYWKRTSLWWCSTIPDRFCKSCRQKMHRTTQNKPIQIFAQGKDRHAPTRFPHLVNCSRRKRNNDWQEKRLFLLRWLPSFSPPLNPSFQCSVPTLPKMFCTRKTKQHHAIWNHACLIPLTNVICLHGHHRIKTATQLSLLCFISVCMHNHIR